MQISKPVGVRSRVTALLSAAAVLCLGATAEATLVAYDGFSAYYTLTATTNGTNNDSLINQHPALTGFTTGNSWVIDQGATAVTTAVYPRASTTGLTYANLPTAGGSAEWWRSSSGTYAKSITRAAVTSDTSAVQWVSFLLKEPTSVASGSEVTVAMGWKNSLTVAFSSSGVASFRFANTTGASTPAFSTAYATGTTHLVLLKIESLTSAGLEKHDQVTMWVDPNFATLNPHNPATLGAGLTGHGILRDDAGTGVIGTFASLQFGAQPSANSTYFDEFRLGTSLYDVAPIPEPASLAVLGLPLLGLRRRRAR